MYALMKATAMWLKCCSQKLKTTWLVQEEKILAGLKTVDSIDCENVEDHGMSMSKITMH